MANWIKISDRQYFNLDSLTEVHTVGSGSSTTVSVRVDCSELIGLEKSFASEQAAFDYAEALVNVTSQVIEF